MNELMLQQGRRRTQDELREIAAQGQAELGDASAEDIVEWAAERIGTRLAVASSMQDAALVHLVSRHIPGVDVLFLDTGYHFPTTLTTRDAVAGAYPVRVRSLTAAQSPAEQDAAYGKDLFATDPDLCCLLRKDTPLDDALQQYDGWMTGLRRSESTTRAQAQSVSFDEAHGLVKVAPLVSWSDADVADYIRTNGVIRHPLLDRGYPSIGCAPCTAPVRPGDDPRSGRWAGRAKTECGIHR